MPTRSQSATASLPALWPWVLHHYAKPDVKQAALALQNGYGMDINVILWLCWLADHKKTPKDQSLIQIIEWQENSLYTHTQGFRSARFSLKGHENMAGYKAVKASLLSIELWLERRFLLALEPLPYMPSPPTSQIPRASEPGADGASKPVPSTKLHPSPKHRGKILIQYWVGILWGASQQTESFFVKPSQRQKRSRLMAVRKSPELDAFLTAIWPV